MVDFFTSSAVYQPTCWHARLRLRTRCRSLTCSCVSTVWALKLRSITATTRIRSSTTFSPHAPSSGVSHTSLTTQQVRHQRHLTVTFRKPYTTISSARGKLELLRRSYRNLVCGWCIAFYSFIPRTKMFSRTPLFLISLPDHWVLHTRVQLLYACTEVRQFTKLEQRGK